MSKLAEEILGRIDAWPKEAQAELMQSIVDIEEKHVGLYRLTEDERAAVRRGLMKCAKAGLQAKNGSQRYSIATVHEGSLH